MSRLLYTQTLQEQRVYVNLDLPVYPPLPAPLATRILFPASVTSFLFCISVPLNHLLRFHIEAILRAICPSLSDFTQDDKLQVHPCLCTWHCFILLYGSSYSLACMYHIFCIHSSVGHLSCFHAPAIGNSAAMNAGVHVSL